MSGEPTSVPRFKEVADVATDFEIRGTLAGEDNENKRMMSAKTTTSNTVEKSCNPKFKTCCEWSVICAVIAVIWGLLALPTIYYRTLQSPAASNNTSQCITENYTESVCMSDLTARQKCVPHCRCSSEIYVQLSAKQEDVESQVTLQLSNPSPECGEVVEPFLCFYYFGLCGSSGELYLPSAGECETLKTQTCAREFEIAVSILGNASLPQCKVLPSDREIDCNGVYGTEVGSGSGGTECTARMGNGTMVELLVSFEDQSDNSSESSMAICRPITCREDFYLNKVNETSSCLPECSKWESLPHGVVVATHVIVLLMAVVYVVSASVLLLLSCLSHKRMFKFPSVFIIYQMFPLGLFEIFLLIAFTDRERLFCSQRDVIGSLADSTPFCTIQGLVFHYMVTQALLLWLFHILAIFFGLQFPMRAKFLKKDGYFRYIHLIMLGLAIVLPCIPIAVVQATGGSMLVTSPPFQCYATNIDAIYYTVILPGCIMLGTGITLTILILHIIIHATESRKRTLNRRPVKTQGSWCIVLDAHIRRVLRLHSGEVKILIISCYFTILAVFIVTTFTLHKIQDLEKVISDLTNYFACEATGTLKECDKPFMGLQRRTVSIVTFVLIGLYPIVNLVYVLNIPELKQKISPRSKSTRSSNGIAPTEMIPQLQVKLSP